MFLDECCDEVLERLFSGEDCDVDRFTSSIAGIDLQVAEILGAARFLVGQRSEQARHVGRYELLRLIGRGASGRVYEALQHSVGRRRVAIKIFEIAPWATTRMHRFEREVQALAQLRHPNIVEIYEVVTSDGVLGIVTELVDGLPLSQWVASARHEAQLPPSLRLLERVLDRGVVTGEASVTDFVVGIGIDIARALAAVHRIGCVHRDVRPANILLAKDGRALLCDFGLVLQGDAPQVTQSGAIVGTPCYASPEQLRGAKPDARSDVYSLSVTLYELLSLAYPFEATTANAILDQVERAQSVPLRRRAPFVPSSLEAAIQKALSADPMQRYASADEFADDVERWRSGEAMRATGGWRWRRRWRRLCQSSRRLSIAASVAIVAVILVLWYGESLRRQARSAAAKLRRDAQIVLLDPRMTGWLLDGAFPNNAANPDRRFIEEVRDRAAAVLGEALELSPHDVEMRIERELLLSAIHRDAEPRAQRSQWLEQLIPLTARSMFAYGAGEDDPCIVHDVELEGASALDRRSLGFFAYCIGDVDLCLRAWRQPPGVAARDPFVACALAQHWLYVDEPALAHDSMRDAFESFADIGYLVVNYADAALRAGFVDRAAELVRHAASLGNHLSDEGLERVRAGISAARGDLDGAWSALQPLLSRHVAPSLYRDAARVAIQRGDFESGLALLSFRTRTYPHAVLWAQNLVDEAEKWWSSLSPAGRESRLRTWMASCDGPLGLDGMNFVLGQMSAAIRFGNRGKSASTEPSTSAHVRWPSLMQLAETLRGDRMKLETTLSLPSWLQRAWAKRWSTCDPNPSTRMLAFVSRAWVAGAAGIAAVTFAASSPAQATTGGYEAALGTLPTAQGFAAWKDIATQTQVTNGVLRQRATSTRGYEFWQRLLPEVDLTKGFWIEFDLQAIDCPWASQNIGGWNMSLGSAKHYVAVMIANDRVTLGNGSVDLQLPMNTRSGFHRYRIDGAGTSATLRVNGTPVLTVPLVPYLGDPRYKNRVYFGKGSGWAACSADLRYFRHGPFGGLASNDREIPNHYPSNKDLAEFYLSVGAQHSGKFYMLAGTLSGTQPGFQFFGHNVQILPDSYTVLLASTTNALIPGCVGVISPTGHATARFRVPSFVKNLTFHHVGIVFDSNLNGVSLVTPPLELKT